MPTGPKNYYLLLVEFIALSMLPVYIGALTNKRYNYSRSGGITGEASRVLVPLDQELFDAIFATTSSVSQIQDLIAQGADVNAEGYSCDSPLIRAVRMAKPDIVITLLAAGANVNSRNNNGDTALDEAKIKLDMSSTSFILSEEEKQDTTARLDKIIQLLENSDAVKNDITILKDARKKMTTWGIFTFVDKTSPEELKSLLKKELFIRGASKEQQEQWADEGIEAQIPEGLLSTFNDAARLKKEYPDQWEQYITDKR